jgi:hypothetical protein
MSRYITSALVASSVPVPCVDGHSRAYLAATLATAFTDHPCERGARRLHAVALTTQTMLARLLRLDELDRLVTLAEAMRDAAREEPAEDRVPLMACVVRDLLDGAPATCVDLDRAVREAVVKRYKPSPAHVASAARIVEAVL